MADSVVITGANRGFGLSLAKRFLRGGFHVFAGMRCSGGQLEALAGQSPGRLDLVALEVTDQASIQRAAQTVASRTPALDVLINNAAVFLQKPDKPLEQMDFDDMHFQQTIEVNTIGPLRVIQHFIPLLERGKRKLIINVSSGAGSIASCGRVGEYAYCVSKAGLNMASRILQNYLAPRGFKVLSLDPGWMRTDMGGPDAHLDPDESADCVFALAEKEWSPTGEVFVDYRGQVLPW